MTTYDEAQALSWMQDTESPSETEEREIIEAGRALDIESDRDAVEAADQAARDWADYLEQERTYASEVPHWYY